MEVVEGDSEFTSTSRCDQRKSPQRRAGATGERNREIGRLPLAPAGCGPGNRP